ncbi:hypothetical protein JCM16303_000374 [Sporobolomyces ruberrimus]
MPRTRAFHKKRIQLEEAAAQQPEDHEEAGFLEPSKDSASTMDESFFADSGSERDNLSDFEDPDVPDESDGPEARDGYAGHDEDAVSQAKSETLEAKKKLKEQRARNRQRKNRERKEILGDSKSSEARALRLKIKRENNQHRANVHKNRDKVKAQREEAKIEAHQSGRGEEWEKEDRARKDKENREKAESKNKQRQKNRDQKLLMKRLAEREASDQDAEGESDDDSENAVQRSRKKTVPTMKYAWTPQEREAYAASKKRTKKEREAERYHGDPAYRAKKIRDGRNRYHEQKKEREEIVRRNDPQELAAMEAEQKKEKAANSKANAEAYQRKKIKREAEKAKAYENPETRKAFDEQQKIKVQERRESSSRSGKKTRLLRRLSRRKAVDEDALGESDDDDVAQIQRSLGRVPLGLRQAQIYGQSHTRRRSLF